MKPAVFIIIIVAFIAGATTGILYEKMERGLLKQDTIRVVETKFERIYVKAKTKFVNPETCCPTPQDSLVLYKEPKVAWTFPTKPIRIDSSMIPNKIVLEALADTNISRVISWNGQKLGFTDTIKLSFRLPENQFGINLLTELKTDTPSESTFWQDLATYGLSGLLGVLVVIAIQSL